VVTSMATDRRALTGVAGLAIGLTIVICALSGGPLTGASMNPARSLGPALFAGGSALTSVWIYILGPLLGGALGASAYEAIRGGERHVAGAEEDAVV
jgi:glycerol uptake facilitator-like aquaporin